MSVTAIIEPLALPTYPVGAPEKNPVFFEKRVYQGSCGAVYPVPFIDKVYDEPSMKAFCSARIENEYVRLVLLPEIGGRIFSGQDKTNRDYDFFYRQDVIKPALVGLAGPWISGGVEFNWPQHHRPGTFMPSDVFIEDEGGGVWTVWISEHDPICRLKGMHGVRLRPGTALVELRVRLFNRTPFTQTFLWWANAAAKVHEQYQSFFPPDVHYVADHAVRAQVTFPRAQQNYYGVAYQRRPGADDLTWYKNIPVPTSYMICETAFDFLGGYDYTAQGGFVHVANRHIAPGKKQWTWGNHEFGWAWDRELTDRGGPYIELMSGVYTDNQPDFSYLNPYETRTFSQYWWPIQKIGPVQAVSTEAALRLVATDSGEVDFGAAVPAPIDGARLVLTDGDCVLCDERIELQPARPYIATKARRSRGEATMLCLRLFDAKGRAVISYRPPKIDTTTRARSVAKEPATPAETKSNDVLFLTGEHLEQYRHPTRAPEDYWGEALRRDPGDARCNLAMGRRLLRKGLFDDAVPYLEAAIGRLTERHPNPVTGEAHYALGLLRRWQGRDDDAYGLLYKATWNYEWRAPAYYEIACIDHKRGALDAALGHLEQSLDANRQNNKARVLRAIVLSRLGRAAEAREGLEALLKEDPLDHWARCEQGRRDDDFGCFLKLSRNDAQTILDVAFDYSDAGCDEEAIELLRLHHREPVQECPLPNPLSKSQSTRYALAWLLAKREGRTESEWRNALAEARSQRPDHYFPSRLHEQTILKWALGQDGKDPVAGYGLGNMYYDLRRHEEAVLAWEGSVAAGAAFSTVFRNLGLAYWNVRREGASARRSYERALELDARDARIVYEFDQLRKKLNEPVEERLAWLEERKTLVMQRDDATVELAALYNLSGQPGKALDMLLARRFHPWEGGEGAVLRQYTAARLLLGQEELKAGKPAEALKQFERAMNTPANLGEAYHLLQAKADVNYWLGKALCVQGREAEAAACFEASASEAADFAEMAVTEHSPLSYYRGLSLRAMGREAEAAALFESLRDYAQKRLGQTARIDYFATSLPNLMVFDEDLQARRDAECELLLALAAHGLGERAVAAEHLARSRAFSNAEPRGNDLARMLKEER